MRLMNYDKYGEVINGEATYNNIAMRLVKGQSVFIGWTDQGYDHRDIMFIYNSEEDNLRKFGDNIQRGMRWSNFFIGIIPDKFYGFNIENQTDNRKHESYLKEKLKLNDNDCDDKICELINGVINQVDKWEGNVK